MFLLDFYFCFNLNYENKDGKTIKAELSKKQLTELNCSVSVGLRIKNYTKQGMEECIS